MLCIYLGYSCWRDGCFEKNYAKFEPNIIDKLLFIGDVSRGALTYKPAIDTIKSKNIPFINMSLEC